MKKTIRAYEILAIILTILGTALSAASVFGGVYAIFNNWESHEEITVSFKANETSKTTDYYACKCDSLRMYQEKGNGLCTYNVYYRPRNQSYYDKIVMGLCFSENEKATAPYSLTSYWWNDVRFKVNKTSATSEASKIILSLGQSTD